MVERCKPVFIFSRYDLAQRYPLILHFRRSLLRPDFDLNEIKDVFDRVDVQITSGPVENVLTARVLQSKFGDITTHLEVVIQSVVNLCFSEIGVVLAISGKGIDNVAELFVNRVIV